MKRTAEHQITKDDPGGEDGAPGGAPTEGFAKAAPEVMKKRRILKVRRTRPSANDSAPAADAEPKVNPFASIAAQPKVNPFASIAVATPTPAPVAAAPAPPAAPVAAAAAPSTAVAPPAAPVAPVVAPSAEAPVAASSTTVPDAAPVSSPAKIAGGGDAAVEGDHGAAAESKATAAASEVANRTPDATASAPAPSVAAPVAAAPAADAAAGDAPPATASEVTTAAAPAATEGAPAGAPEAAAPSATPATAHGPAGEQKTEEKASANPSVAAAVTPAAPFTFGTFAGGSGTSASPFATAAGNGGFSFTAAPAVSSSASAEKKEASEPKFEEKVVETGEEGEKEVFKSKSKVFILEESKWKERGVGTFKMNVDSDSGRARLVMRTDVTLRLTLNAPLYKEFTLGKAGERGVTFRCVAEEKSFLVRFRSKTEVEALEAEVEKWKKSA